MSSLPITMTSAPQGAQGAQPAPDTVVADQPWIKYPPFPAPPAGATIIPFSKFKPAGIQINIDPGEDDIELDGLGVPTVKLAVRHDLTDAERRKRKKKAITAPDGTVRLPPWFEDWAVAEHLRRTAVPIDPSISRVDRLHQASQDFKSGRSWPGVGSGVPQLWDAFRLYVGIISSVHPPLSRKRMQMMQAAAAEAEDDSDDDGEGEGEGEGGAREQPVIMVEDEHALGLGGAQPHEPRKTDETDEARQLRRESFREAKDLRMDAFFDDTERNIKVFFSSYYRDKGLMWSEQRTRDGPVLIGFFLNFLLRNRVLPEPEHGKGLQRALLVVEQARKELPATFVIGKAIPDQFSDGCKDLFGNMTLGMMWQDVDADSAPEEPDAKRRKVHEGEAKTQENKEQEAKIETEEERVLKDAAGAVDIEVLSPDAVKEIEDEVKKDSAADRVDGWGEPSAGGWDNTWGEMDVDPAAWGTEAQLNLIMRFLGPTVFPLTHTTGIVERSTRRIVSITPASRTKPGKKKKGRGAAELVEEELAVRLASMVLAPWAVFDENEHADVNRPLILPDSRGALVTDQNGSVAGDANTPAAHNPLKDEITVLLDPDVADKLIVGMGLGATWVQIARQAPSGPTEIDTGKKQKGAYGEAGEPTKFWYMEYFVSTLPSFHTEQ